MVGDDHPAFATQLLQSVILPAEKHFPANDLIIIVHLELAAENQTILILPHFGRLHLKGIRVKKIPQSRAADVQPDEGCCGIIEQTACILVTQDAVPFVVPTGGGIPGFSQTLCRGKRILWVSHGKVFIVTVLRGRRSESGDIFLLIQFIESSINHARHRGIIWFIFPFLHPRAFHLDIDSLVIQGFQVNDALLNMGEERIGVNGLVCAQNGKDNRQQRKNDHYPSHLRTLMVRNDALMVGKRHRRIEVELICP